MRIELIRHATIKIKLNDVTFLVDPMFSAKGEMDPVANAANSIRNPLVDLPFSKNHILKDIEAVILTHSHRDHFDAAAIQSIPKNIPIFCQPEDEEKLVDLGFLNVMKVKNKVVWKGIQLIRTGGQHGTGELAKQMGPVSGFIMKEDGEAPIYIVGDSIWCNQVQDAINDYSPELIIVNGGEAQFLTGDPITMGFRDIEKVWEEAPNSKIIVVHMESWNHCLLSREELVESMNSRGIEDVFVPANGEILDF